MKIKLRGYLESSRLDKEGAKHIQFEISAKQAVEAAKLELMGRDLKEFLPVLLEITVGAVGNGKEKRKTLKEEYNFLKTS